MIVMRIAMTPSLNASIRPAPTERLSLWWFSPIDPSGDDDDHALASEVSRKAGMIVSP